MSFANPEQYMRHFEPEPALTPVEAALADALNASTEAFKTSVRLDDFARVYPQEMIATDLQKVRSREQRHIGYSGERSELATRVLLHTVSNLEYLKPADENWDVYIDVGSRFDDVMRGTDAVITFYNNETGEELPLAVDTTSSSGYAANTTEKVERALQDIEKGWLTQIKYYRSPITEKPVGKVSAPKVIFALSRDDSMIIAQEYGRHKNTAFKNLEFEDQTREVFIQQLQNQLEVAQKQLQQTSHKDRLQHRLETIIDLLSPASTETEEN